MRKLTPAQVSYRDNFLISYCVYMMMGHFISCLFEGTLHDDKIHVQFKIAHIIYACAICRSPPADRFYSQMGGHFAFT